MSNWLVLKFGGTSVSSRENWDNIVRVLKERREDGYKVCIVHSAIGGISNLLESLMEEAKKGDAGDVLQEIRDIHLSLAKELDINGEEVLEPYLAKLQKLVTGISLIGEISPRIHARIMALGELMATALSTKYLKQKKFDVSWTDAREWLFSDSTEQFSESSAYLSATCEYFPDSKLKSQFDDLGGIVLTQGFIAQNGEGETVLLGRGGSDVSASYFATKLEADHLEIWTDVPGMFTADPRTIPSARLIKSLNYEEAQEIATNGATVLHPRCILPSQEYGIPIDIRCTNRPDIQGTHISKEVKEDHARVKAIAMRTGVRLVTMETVGMWQKVGFLADAFSRFRDHGLSIDLVSTSETSVTVTLDPSANLHFDEVRSRLKKDLEQICNVKIIERGAAISLLGRQIRAILHQLGPTFEVFEDQNIYLVSQAANDLNFTVVVDQNQAERLVKQLHELLIYKMADDVVLGPTWEELFTAATESEEFSEKWWNRKRDQLLTLAEEESPVFVYDEDEIRGAAEQLNEMTSVDQVFYAVKANNNAEVLQVFLDEGLGFECVSPGEIAYIKKLFPNIDNSKILFTPNFAPREEYEYALEEGVWVTVDNLYILEQWPEIFEDEQIFIRVDPGEGKGHHKHVRTGGRHAKFGIPFFEMDELEAQVESAGADVVGLHAHAGSGIMDHQNWRHIATLLAELTERFPNVHTIDVGGGLGIKEKPGQGVLDLDAMDQELASVKGAYPDLDFWIEPGRFLVSDGGVLLTKVTQLKGKGDVKYVGTETGMNSLIRPALYGSYHPIVNLTRLDKDTVEAVNIVGPICESGDKLGIDRRFPETRENDVLLIANAGAYGRVMSSTYNMRQPASEKVI